MMNNNSPLIISVTGWSGSGKTTFCEQLISELVWRGTRTAAAKNSHQTLDMDKPGSDSKRFFDAGAESVCLNAENSMTLFHHDRLEDGSRLVDMFPEADYIVAEGFKAKGALRIEVTGLIETIAEMKNPPSEADIIVYGSNKLLEAIQSWKSESGVEKPTNCIARNQITKAAELVMNGHL